MSYVLDAFAAAQLEQQIPELGCALKPEILGCLLHLLFEILDSALQLLGSHLLRVLEIGVSRIRLGCLYNISDGLDNSLRRDAVLTIVGLLQLTPSDSLVDGVCDPRTL